MARCDLPAALAPVVRALWAARASVADTQPDDPGEGAPDGRVSPAGGSLPTSGSWPADGAGRPAAVRAADLVQRCEEFTRGHRSVLRQQSDVTCGPNVLAMFRVLTDPAFLPRARATRDGDGWGALEGRLHAAMNSGAGTLPWPTAWGTLPWVLAHHLQALTPPGPGWRVLRADPHDLGRVRRLLDVAGGWCRAGLPIPVYLGNDRLPRHVVLLLSATPRPCEPRPDGPRGPGSLAPPPSTHPREALTLYDPAIGDLRRAPTGELIDGRRPVAGWRRVWCVLVPS